MFKAELFGADKWAEIFVKSGAKYIVPTSKHHEGFCLWPSAQSFNRHGSKMLAADGTFLPGLTFDFCHPAEKGYQIWADGIRSLISEP